MRSQEPAILDASALLSYVRWEPGADRVERAVGSGALISAVNWAETLSRLSDLGVDLGQVERTLRERGLLGQALEVVPFDEAQARESARLRRSTRELGLSLGDRACLALGLSRGLPVLTADRAWSKLSLKVRVVQIR